MTEADKDALLVRAALDIMTFQSRVARLEKQLQHAYQLAAAMQRAASGEKSNPDNVLSLERAVSLHISSAYYACNKDIRRTARVLGISPPTVYKYLPQRVASQRKSMSTHREVKTL